MIQAAGILFKAPTGRVLLLQRSANGDHAGEWCTPGGKIEDGETAEQAAFRECFEEIGYRAGVGPEIMHRIKDEVDFITFLNECDSEFTPTLNDEHIAFEWVDPNQFLSDV